MKYIYNNSRSIHSDLKATMKAGCSSMSFQDAQSHPGFKEFRVLSYPCKIDMATYETLFVRAAKNNNRTLEYIADEYGIPASSCTDKGEFVEVTLIGRRNERLPRPNNGDIWALCCDDGSCYTNDVEGKFFQYWMKTEEAGEFLTTEAAFMEIFKSTWQKFHSTPFPFSFEDLKNRILPYADVSTIGFWSELSHEEKVFVNSILDNMGEVAMIPITVIK